MPQNMDLQSDEVQTITCWPPDSPGSSPSHATEVISNQQHVVMKHSIDADDSFFHPLKKKRFCTEKSHHEYDFAEMALVKWWKRQVRGNMSKDGHDIALGAYSKMAMITSSATGQEFLRAQLKQLMMLHPCTQNPHILAVIGSYQEKLGAFEDAKANLNKALESSLEDTEIKWLLARVEKQLQVLHAQRQMLQSPGPSQDAFPASHPVDRVRQADLSFSDFFTKYALTHTPVIITGLQITQQPWTLHHIRDKAGLRSVTPKRLVPGSIEWAKLENAAPTTVAEYIDSLPPENPDPENPDPDCSDPAGIQQDTGRDTYLFDWSLPQYAPELVEEVIIPRYFAGDLLQHVNKGSLYRDTWPSLFIAPAGLKSELHVDTFASNFWMALLQGKKRWVFFSREDLPLLYPRYPHSMDPCFDPDLSRPDLGKFPLLARTTPKECVLEAGEVLFVPSGCPHYVENLTQSIAISANYIDPSNLSLVLKELAINGLRDPCAQQLHEELSRKCEHLMDNVEDQECHHQLQGGHECHHQLQGGQECHHQLQGGQECHHQLQGGQESHHQLQGGQECHKQLLGGHEYHKLQGDHVPADQVSHHSGGVRAHEELRRECRELIDNNKDETYKDTTNSMTVVTKHIRGDHQRQSVSNMVVTDLKDVGVLEVDSTNLRKCTEIVGQRNYVYKNSHVEKWIQEVERKGDLRWHDFKTSVYKQ